MSSIHALTMPKWGLSMKEGKIVDWLVEEGTDLATGVECVEIETDKILGSLETPVAGVLRRKVAGKGDLVPVAGLLAVIAEASVSDSQVELFVQNFQTSFVLEKETLAESIPPPETIAVGQHSIRYLKRGKGEEAVILIHGFGGDLNNWLFNHEELAAKRTVYAFDLPGHGGSSKGVGGGTLLELTQTLEGFMKKVEIPKAHIVGHSMGGAVALGFAVNSPERVGSLTLVSSAALGREIDANFIEGFIAADRRKDLKPQLDRLFVDSGLVGRQMVEDVLKYKRLDGVEMALRTLATRFFPDGQQAVDLRDRLGHLSMPVFVIWGAEDKILPASHATHLPQNVRTEVLPNCGHMIQMEAAAKFNRQLQSFWDSVPA
ncbi:MAG: acetoin dehydrogenase dihydrolipoyllysine-residue acetyltransferase subunit [Terriglobia bacterium]